MGPGVGTGRQCPEEAPSRLRPGSSRWSGQERYVWGTGDRKQGLCSTGSQTASGKGPGSERLGAVVRNAITILPLKCFSSFFRTVPQRMWSHFWKVSTQGLFVAMFWPLIPQFVCNCLFYWALYFNPIINIDHVVKEVRRLETQVL